MEYYRVQMEELAKKICAEMHLALYDIDEKLSNKGRIYTIYLTKIGGVTLDECAKFSRTLSELLDELDIIPDRYFLEVSSPGIERPLKLKSHYVSAINEKIVIQWNQDEVKRSTMGTLLEVNQDYILVDDRGENLEIPFKSITRAKTIFVGTLEERG
ncbi:MAG TPA: ribosome maturation factor RimP [Candidatus Cloacimonadota bacterium]|nr:ribosome maturation factor RimP [Candidatus Cloacimonadota bacterium]HPS39417.1 ribosome maturation factor RimP [Candidatus Cloacimonadota bacterium]